MMSETGRGLMPARGRSQQKVSVIGHLASQFLAYLLAVTDYVKTYYDYRMWNGRHQCSSQYRAGCPRDLQPRSRTCHTSCRGHPSVPKTLAPCRAIRTCCNYPPPFVCPARRSRPCPLHGSCHILETPRVVSREGRCERTAQRRIRPCRCITS